MMNRHTLMTPERTTLHEKNTAWRKNKVRTAAKFFALGLLGLVLPVIPGLLLIGYALWLVFPAPIERLMQKFKRRA